MTYSLSVLDSERTDQRPGRIYAGLLICALLIGCAGSPPASQTPEPTVQARPAASGWLDHSPLPTVLRLATYPATPTQLRTTSATIYLGNLDARIAQLEKVYADQPRADVAHALALSLGHRYRIIGRYIDAVRAGQVIQEQLQNSPEHPQLLLTQARWLAQFHQFDQARDALERIPAPGPGLAEPIAALRSEINLALGNYSQLGPSFWQPELPGSADVYELASRANAAVLHGKLDLASRLYFDAQSRYRDVGPFPLAWLHVQQGIALLRFGHYPEAAEFFRTARERLPQYYLATEHLAECLTQMGQYDEARELYVEVIAQTGNPEFEAALAGLERAAGNPEQAQRWQSKADQGYQALLVQYPAAYAQHAAEFYLEIGQSEKADQLASENLQLRQDLASRLLLAEVALARNDRNRACAQLSLAAESGLQPPEMRSLQAEADCG